MFVVVSHLLLCLRKATLFGNSEYLALQLWANTAYVCWCTPALGDEMWAGNAWLLECVCGCIGTQLCLTLSVGEGGDRVVAVQLVVTRMNLSGH
jgi:hypothetical protein